MTERKKTLALLTKLYGPLKEGERVEFANISSRNVANDLGYDEGQLSRILNPGHGKEKSDDTYRRLAQRTKMNRAAKNHKLFKICTAVLGVILLALAIQFFRTSEDVEQPALSTENRLTAIETSSMVALYNGYIKAQLINQGIIFNSQVKEGVYLSEDLKNHVHNLSIEIDNTLTNTRNLLGLVNLSTQNGIELSTLFEQFNENNIDKHLEDIIKILKNTEISYASIQSTIESRLDFIQNRNAEVFDSIAALPIENVVFPLAPG